LRRKDQQRHGTEIKLIFGIEPKALTYSERSKRLSAKGLSESANDGDVMST
jgi:hypothetical protein